MDIRKSGEELPIQGKYNHLKTPMKNRNYHPSGKKAKKHKGQQTLPLITCHYYENKAICSYIISIRRGRSLHNKRSADNKLKPHPCSQSTPSMVGKLRHQQRPLR